MNDDLTLYVFGARIAVIAMPLIFSRLEDVPHPDEEPECDCEYVDVGIGVMLAAPSPDCPVHSDEVLAVMTYRRHESERVLRVAPERTHWGHEGCPCGCGEVST